MPKPKPKRKSKPPSDRRIADLEQRVSFLEVTVVRLTANTEAGLDSILALLETRAKEFDAAVKAAGEARAKQASRELDEIRRIMSERLGAIPDDDDEPEPMQ